MHCVCTRIPLQHLRVTKFKRIFGLHSLSSSFNISSSFRSTPAASSRIYSKSSLATDFRAMIDTEEFNSIAGELRKEDEERETIIKRSRDVQKLSKQAIFSLHRDNMQEAKDRLNKAESAAKELMPKIASYPKLRFGSFSNALEEYAEAMIFLGYIQDGTLMKRSQIPLIELDEYLGGVLDFTGELLRHSIKKATSRDVAAVQKAKDLVDGIMGCFLEFDLRNGSIRKKYDALKYTLKKLENTLYELSLSAQIGMKDDFMGKEDENQDDS